MGWFAKDIEPKVETIELTVQQKISWLFSEKERLATEISEASRIRVAQKEADLGITRAYEAIVKELLSHGIKS